MNTVFEAFMATAAAAPDRPFLCAPPAPGRSYHPDGRRIFTAFANGVLSSPRPW